MKINLIAERQDYYVADMGGYLLNVVCYEFVYKQLGKTPDKIRITIQDEKGKGFVPLVVTRNRWGNMVYLTDDFCWGDLLSGAEQLLDKYVEDVATFYVKVQDASISH